MIPEINKPFIVGFITSDVRWKEQYPFEAEIKEINSTDKDREFKILNKRSGHFLEVEKNWFDTELTNRTIKIL